VAHLLAIHPRNPQERLVRQAADVVREGGVVVYPTDSCYALGCAVANKEGVARIERIRGLPPGHNFTLICRELSDSSTYAIFVTPV
jgi:tRNA threonylcarbamoyl adenosine modification protein (Sua5/YciO/YrdC/YwlC family)